MSCFFVGPSYDGWSWRLGFAAQEEVNCNFGARSIFYGFGFDSWSDVFVGFCIENCCGKVSSNLEMEICVLILDTF